MGIQNWFTYHTHYWGVPHQVEGEDRLIHECYECGKQRDSILGTDSQPLEVFKQPEIDPVEGKFTDGTN